METAATAERLVDSGLNREFPENVHLHDDPGEEGEHDELEDRGAHTENHDVLKVLEELLALHVVPCREDDGGQNKVEEEVFIEGHDFIEVLVAHLEGNE